MAPFEVRFLSSSLRATTPTPLRARTMDAQTNTAQKRAHKDAGGLCFRDRTTGALFHYDPLLSAPRKAETGRQRRLSQIFDYVLIYRPVDLGPEHCCVFSRRIMGSSLIAPDTGQRERSFGYGRFRFRKTGLTCNIPVAPTESGEAERIPWRRTAMPKTQSRPKTSTWTA